MTMSAFQQLVASKLNIPSHFQVVLAMDGSTGLRPKFKQLSTHRQNESLASHGIKSGHSLVIKDARNESGPKDQVRKGTGWEYPATIGKQGMMKRKDMPKDNSCLFHSIAFITDEKNDTKESAAYPLRHLAAQIIASDPARYNTAVLGMPNANYLNVVTDPNQWGGGIELSLFARHFALEIVAFDYHYLREDQFGQGEGYKKRCYLIYTGEHYDVLTWTDDKGKLTKLFSPKDINAWQRARDYIQTVHQTAVKAGKCALQKEWRREIKKSTPVRKLYTAGSNRLGSTANEWKCPTCTYINPPTKPTCAMCGTKKTSKPTPKPTPNPIPNRTPNPTPTQPIAPTKPDPKPALVDSKSNNPAPSSDSKQQESKHLKPKPKKPKKPKDAWNCPGCTYENLITPDRCQMCHTTNPNYVPDRSLFPDMIPPMPPGASGAANNDSRTLQTLIGGDQGGSNVDPTMIQQLQLASLPAWVCPRCRVLNHRGTVRCALDDCRCPNPVVGGVIPPAAHQSSSAGCIVS